MLEDWSATPRTTHTIDTLVEDLVKDSERTTSGPVGTCPSCGYHGVVLPVEPMFTYELALAMLPLTTYEALKVKVNEMRHEMDPPVYAIRPGNRRMRLFTCHDIQVLRRGIKRIHQRGINAMLQRLGLLHVSS